ncbi:MAG: GC-type dockerin domain-anchored protein [Phycisphaerales bacterium]
MRAISFVLAAAFLPALVVADPTIPNATTTTYGTFPADYRPYTITLDPAGFLYAGSDNNDVAGITLRRIPPGGGPAVPFSTAPVYDPDGIICDRAGVFSGVTGAIIVAYTVNTGPEGAIGIFSPGGVLGVRISPTSVLANNDAMAFDSQGRLYVNAYAAGTIVRITAADPQVFVTMPGGIGGGILAIDTDNKLWISCSDGALRRYSSTGTLEATIPVGGAFPTLGFCPVAGALPAGLYTFNRDNGNLLRVTATDTLVPAGSGFPTTVYHLIFNAAGDLFSADWATGTVWKTSRGCGNRADVASLGGAAGPDGQLTADDIILYLASFFSGNLAIADIASLGGNPAPDGQLTPDDLISFLSAFFAGCP